MGVEQPRQRAPVQQVADGALRAPALLEWGEGERAHAASSPAPLRSPATRADGFQAAPGQPREPVEQLVHAEQPLGLLVGR